MPESSTSSQPLASAMCSKVCWVNASPAAVAPTKPATPSLFRASPPRPGRRTCAGSAARPRRAGPSVEQQLGPPVAGHRELRGVVAGQVERALGERVGETEVGRRSGRPPRCRAAGRPRASAAAASGTAPTTSGRSSDAADDRMSCWNWSSSTPTRSTVTPVASVNRAASAFCASNLSGRFSSVQTVDSVARPVPRARCHRTRWPGPAPPSRGRRRCGCVSSSTFSPRSVIGD